MTEESKIEKMIEHLTEWHLDHFGGYPYDYQILDDGVFVAELDDAKERQRTKLVWYSKESLIKWFDRATKYGEEENLGWTDSLLETAGE